jgi:threonine dehydrogenase-like Zn-dependent dehydrogenase
MFIDIEHSQFTMKRTYTLAREVELAPQTVEKAQRLTLDRSRPKMGLKGRHGLFASPEWWKNVENGTIDILRIQGQVVDVYAAGPDATALPDMIDIAAPDGTVVSAGIYVNDPNDVALYTVGRQVELVYALDELKDQPAVDGGINRARIALEMAVSV